MDENVNFSCSDEDCKMTFSSENQLKNHRKNNHDMVLSFSKNSDLNNGVDETPTPVRFLRDCEAVGIFQELSKNPFEETFRKAAEANHRGGLSFSSAASNEDTLNTPQVFPSIADDDSKSKTPTVISDISETIDDDCESLESERIVKQEADTSILPTPTIPFPVTRPDDSRGTSHGLVAAAAPLSNQNSSYNFFSLQPAPPEPTEVQLCLKVSHGATLELAGNTLKILGSQEQNNIPQKQGNLILEQGDIRTVIFTSNQNLPQHHQLQQPLANNVKQKLKHFLGNSKEKKILSPPRKQFQKREHNPEKFQINQSSTASNIDNAPVSDRKKQMLREKNRAAAMRCRERRKAWVNELTKRADEMSATNKVLVQEVSLLRAEVARLKALLLAHRDCPVTLAAQSAAAAAAAVHTVVDLSVEPSLPAMVRPAKESKKQRGSRLLSLDIESAMSHSASQSIVEAPSPLVRKDEILTSVAPTTPSDLPQPNHLLDGDVEIIGERSLATPVIQLNPNARGKDNGYR